jgi:hypothetical protein
MYKAFFSVYITMWRMLNGMLAIKKISSSMNPFIINSVLAFLNVKRDYLCIIQNTVCCGNECVQFVRYFIPKEARMNPEIDKANPKGTPNRQ